MTGMISSLFSTARYAFASVCASTPCDASTSRSAPSHAASDRVTSYEKSTCPGVSIRFSTYSSPAFDVYDSRTGWALIVMPRSRSRSMASSTCASISRACSAPVTSRNRSARVDLPWSMCAMTEKLRMKRGSIQGKISIITAWDAGASKRRGAKTYQTAGSTAVEKGDCSRQMRQTLEGIQKTLKAAGSSLATAASVTVYLRNASDFAAMNEVYAAYFLKDPPARTTVVVTQPLANADGLV